MRVRKGYVWSLIVCAICKSLQPHLTQHAATIDQSGSKFGITTLCPSAELTLPAANGAQQERLLQWIRISRMVSLCQGFYLRSLKRLGIRLS